jgi:pimeloyl-ACP methyl ester carboxylesterase
MVSRMPPPNRSEERLDGAEPPTLHHYGRSDVDAPTLLLLHGLTDSGRCWPEAVRRWQQDYRVITWDARGHGGSERFTRQELEAGVGETHLDDLVEVLTELADDGSSRPVLVGHSMGGGTAAGLSATRPDLVRAVVLEDPALGSGRRDDLEERAMASRRVAEAKATIADPAQALRQGRREHPDWPEAEYGPWLEAKLQTDLDMLADPTITVRRNWSEVAQAIAVPALVITGESGAIWTGRLLRKLRNVPNAYLEIEIVRGAGHCVRRDRSDDFHTLVDPWLAKHFAE